MKVGMMVWLMAMVLSGCGSEEFLQQPAFEFQAHQFIRKNESLRLEDNLTNKAPDGLNQYSAHEFALDTRDGAAVTFVKEFGSVVCAGGRGLQEKPTLELVNRHGEVVQKHILDPAVKDYPLSVSESTEYRLRLLVQDSLSCNYGLNFAIR